MAPKSLWLSLLLLGYFNAFVYAQYTYGPGYGNQPIIIRSNDDDGLNNIWPLLFILLAGGFGGCGGGFGGCGGGFGGGCGGGGCGNTIPIPYPIPIPVNCPVITN